MTIKNDPHVTALHYWVEHDDSVDYTNAVPFTYESDLFHLHIDNRQVSIRPKTHFASEEEARDAFEDFISNWEFATALDSEGGTFSLTYSGADIVDRDPKPSPIGIVQLSGTVRGGRGKLGGRLRIGRTTYPAPPPGLILRVDAPYVQTMLLRLARYYKDREPLPAMAYFCLTTMEANTPKGKGNKYKRIGRHFAISRQVLKQVSRLSSEKGGSEARKGSALGKNLTEEERRFLVAAVQAFIRRAAEKATDSIQSLPDITLAGLPAVPKSRELHEDQVGAHQNSPD